VFPLTYVLAKSYKIAPNRRLDLGSNRDGTGVLDRNVLDHTASTISFTVKALNNTRLSELMSFITSRYTVEKERRLSIEYYCPDINDYKTGEFYVPDIEYPIDTIDFEKNIIEYQEFKLEFVEY
jgi:hypothetical protein